MNVLVAILGLGFLILIHETGHFVAARLVGMKPTRFYVGFPPALLKLRRNGIEYGLGAIPLGGYVRIPGMHRPSPRDADLHLDPAVSEAPRLYGPVERLKRALSGDDKEQALAAADEVEETMRSSSLSPAAARAAERGLRDVRDALSPEAYWRQPAWKRVVAIAAGPATNLLLAVLLFAILYMVGGGKPTLHVDSVLPDHPADVAGLRAGDTLVAINGVAVTPEQVPRVINHSHGRLVSVIVERHGTVVNLKPVHSRREGGAYRLGFILGGEGMSAPAAAWNSIRLTGIVTKQIGISLSHLVHSQGRKQLASPVGIVQGSSTALSQGLQSYLWVVGLISLSLALLNLLPLLPLDGGHIAFSIVEGVRGRAVRREIYERVSAVGIVVVVLLFFVGLSNDIGRLGGG